MLQLQGTEMAAHRNRAFSLVRLSFIAICIFAVSSVLAVGALVGVQTSSQEAVSSWRRFADQASGEQRALRAFVTQAGVAGFIDDYHRLAATGDEALVPLVYGKGGAALAALTSYPLTNASGAESSARSTMQALIRAYLVRVDPIMTMHRAGRPVQEILKAADVDGKAAALALETLAGATTRSMISGPTSTDSKALILLDIRRLVGLEGLVHDANRFLAGTGAVSRDSIRQEVADVNVALGRYARHTLTQDERSRLNRFSTEIGGVEARLASDKASGRVSFDASRIQEALLELEKIVYAEAVVAQANLQTTLTEVADRAGRLIVLIGVGAVVLIAGAAWLLVFRIGGRIKAITHAMRNLANGKLDVDIPAAGDRDEIGEMSQALLVFRDGLRANAALTTELAESSRLASLGAMVAGMAHELNTPLGNALAVSSTLEEQCRTFRKDLGSEKLLRSTLDRHASSLEDAAGLIQRNLVRAAEQIGSFKQVAVDQTSGKRREFHLDDVLSSVVQSLGPTFKRTPFSLSLGEASCVVMDSYPGALSQVVTNLVENGLRHGLAGQASGEVAVTVRRVGPHHTDVCVTDTGVGIPEDVRPSIFNAFFTTKAGKGGSGLGLHIVQSIVCGPLGGHIAVSSRPGGGSQFIISIPNKAPPEAPADIVTERRYYAAA